MVMCRDICISPGIYCSGQMNRIRQWNNGHCVNYYWPIRFKFNMPQLRPNLIGSISEVTWVWLRIRHRFEISSIYLLLQVWLTQDYTLSWWHNAISIRSDGSYNWSAKLPVNVRWLIMLIWIIVFTSWSNTAFVRCRYVVLSAYTTPVVIMANLLSQTVDSNIDKAQQSLCWNGVSGYTKIIIMYHYTDTDYWCPWTYFINWN